MSPYIKLTMVFSLITGTLITMTSSHWLMAWMGLEINTFAILPFMVNKHYPRTMEATTKYFIIQTTAATTLLFASLTNAWLTGQWDIQQMNHPLPLTLMTVALALKMGLAPLHAWFPEVLQGLTLTTGLLLSTWQKLAPFSLFLQAPLTNSTLLTLIGLSSILIGGWGGLNQTQLRKILGYSSIAHLGWMILVIQYSPPLTFLTFITYMTLTFSLFFTFKFSHSTTINSLSTSWTKTPILLAITPLTLLSLGGLPPLTGFLPKWLILMELTKQNLTFTATMAALSALLSLFFYLRLSYAMTFTTPPNNLPTHIPWRLNTLHNTTPLATSTMLSLTLLPISPSVLAIIYY